MKQVGLTHADWLEFCKLKAEYEVYTWSAEFDYDTLTAVEDNDTCEVKFFALV